MKGKNNLGWKVKGQCKEISKDIGINCEANYVVRSQLLMLLLFFNVFPGKTRCAVNKGSGSYRVEE